MSRKEEALFQGALLCRVESAIGRISLLLAFAIWSSALITRQDLTGV